MLHLDEFVFWQDKDLSGFDKMLLVNLLSKEFHFYNDIMLGNCLGYLLGAEKLYPYYESLIYWFEYKYPFELEYMKLAFKFYEDEMAALKSALSNASWDDDSDFEEEKILELIRHRKEFEKRFQNENTQKLFTKNILSKLDQVNLNDISFNENFTVNGSLGKVKIGTNKDQKQVAVKINPVWRKSDVDVLKSFLENQKTAPEHNNLIQVYKIGLDVKRREGKRYEYAYFYSMERADNLCGDESYCPKTLANILTGGNKLSPFETVYLLKELTKGLKALYDSGKVHGKIRPKNILWVDNVPKLSELTCVDNFANPFSFKDTILPSEQKSSLSIQSSVDNDIYALAICAYCAVTGNSERMFPELPFEILKTTEGKALNKIFLKACSKSKQARYPSVDKFLEDLEQINLSEVPISFDKKYIPTKAEKIDVFTSILGEEVMSKLDNIKFKDYKVVKNFRGAGGFGDVRIYEHDVWEFRAIKRVNLNNPRARQEAESVVLYKEKAPVHPNLIKIFEVGCDTEIIDNVEEHFFFYTMEAADNLFQLCYPDYRYYHPVSLSPLKYKEKNLKICIMNDGESTMVAPFVLFYHLMQGLSALHKSGLVHRDIKPDNLILVNGVLKISDVGLVTIIDSVQDLAGTEGFLPPEYFDQEILTGNRLKENAIKNDLFAAGISMHNILREYPVEPSQVEEHIVQAINSFQLIREKEKNTEVIDFTYHLICYLRLIKQVCTVDPKQRLNSADELLAQFPEEIGRSDFLDYPDEFDHAYVLDQASKQKASSINHDEVMLSLGRLP